MLRSAIAVLAVALSSVAASAQTLPSEDPLPVVSYSVDVRGEMPSSLTQMYFTHAALQGLDVITTLRALDAGHREANPLLKSGNGALIIGTKVAAASASIYLAKKLWKQNRKAAVLTMVVTNTILSAVVANNARVLSTRR